MCKELGNLCYCHGIFCMAAGVEKSGKLAKECFDGAPKHSNTKGAVERVTYP